MLYKVLRSDGGCYHGGRGSWPLPVENTDGTWTPGEWVEVEGPLVPCESGLHLCDGEAQLLEWLGPAIFEAEYEGERLDEDEKIVVRKARLLRLVEAWNERSARLFACACAERTLLFFERRHPLDTRPRRSIDVARRFANGEATDKELTAARGAARAAAWDAAGTAAWDAAGTAAGAAAGTAARAAAGDAARAAAGAAAWDAARAAAGDAAWDAARDAAWDAAWDAEREWQARRLGEVLSGGEGR